MLDGRPRVLGLLVVRLGDPRPLHFVGTDVPRVSLPGPTSVHSDTQARWHRGQSVNPLCGWL